MSTPSLRQFTAHRGCTLSGYIEGSGPPVVLVQGVGVGATGWRPQSQALSAHFHCLCFDNRGFGASQPSDGELTVELMAEDMLALMDAQGWQSAHVVGHSLGGLVALYAARKARARVRSLSLLCTFASGAIPTRLTPWLLWVGMRTRMGTPRMRRHAFLQLVLPADVLASTDQDALAQQLGELFGHDLAESPPVAMRQFQAMRRADATPFLRELEAIPTLVVNAAHDRIAPPFGGKALAAGLRGARYVEIPDGSHGAPIQHADRINALLLEHLRQAEARWPAAPLPSPGTGPA